MNFERTSFFNVSVSILLLISLNAGWVTRCVDAKASTSPISASISSWTYACGSLFHSSRCGTKDGGADACCTISGCGGGASFLLPNNPVIFLNNPEMPPPGEHVEGFVIFCFV